MSDSNLPWQLYICRACGLIYDEAEGDPDSGLAPGTRFEDIPDDWTCPLCGVTKSDFEPFEKQEISAIPQTAGFSKQPGIVVVGAGLAGWAVIEAIRKENTGIPVTLVCACNGDRYHKPELSVALSRGLNAEKLVQEKSEEAARRLGVRLLNNTFVVGINPSLNQLRTTRGTLEFTQLVLAQGSQPFLPEELPAEKCWRVNHLASWHGLERALSQGPQRVAIVGAGMIGCELAEDLNKAGHQVTLINRNPYPLATLLPEVAASRLADSMTRQGIEHLANAEIARLDETAEGDRQLVLKDDSSVPYDQLVAATGLTTDSRLADQAGLDFNRGIVVNPGSLQTSESDIYALGDCISIDGAPCRFIEPIQHQARAIVNSIFSLNKQNYEHLTPVIRLKTRSLPVILRGLPQPQGHWQTVSQDDDALVMEQYFDNKKIALLELGLSSSNNNNKVA